MTGSADPGSDAPAGLADDGALAIFIGCAPGLETELGDEARELGFAGVEAAAGGVSVTGDWGEVWRANLMLRGASRVLVRVGAFHAVHLAQLAKRARQLPWAEVLRPDVAVRVEASCRRSRIYHSGAAAQRVGEAITASVGAPVEGAAPVRVLARIEKDLCTLSVDASGEPLHKRGFKQAVAKAPMRETLAAMFLRACGYRGGEPVLDPMCGSGTFVIEAAEMTAGLAPGRARSFAFEALASFDADAWCALKAARRGDRVEQDWRHRGYDRDAGAVAMSAANMERAGVGALAAFARAPVSELTRPDGPPGLVIVNPPYGVRVGERGRLRALHQALGRVLLERFSGWRVGLVTADAALARATGLPFAEPGPPVAHGSLRIRLHQTRALA